MEQILTAVAKRRSPVTGESFEPLSAPYKKEKVNDGFSGTPDLSRSGDMLDSLDFRLVDGGLEIGVYGEAALRADGHNNLSGDSELPTRQFLPDVGEEFTSDIMEGVDKLVADGLASEVQSSDLANVNSSSELYDALMETLGLESRAAVRSAVLNSPELYNLLGDEGLLDLL